MTGAQIHPINLKNHEQVADYRIIDNQHIHNYALLRTGITPTIFKPEMDEKAAESMSAIREVWPLQLKWKYDEDWHELFERCGIKETRERL